MKTTDVGHDFLSLGPTWRVGGQGDELKSNNRSRRRR